MELKFDTGNTGRNRYLLLRRPLSTSTAPLNNASAAAPVLGSISGTLGGRPAIATPQ